jgi:4-alpha-glucanotransferase
MSRKNIHYTRGSGVLMHITSLPSPFGIGDLGPEAFAFADFMEAAKQRYWQVLPLNPTNLINGDSPYSSISAFAANTLLISPQRMADEGFIDIEDTLPLAGCTSLRVDYESVCRLKANVFDIAYARFKKSGPAPAYVKFCRQHRAWLDDYAMFVVFKEQFENKSWSQWPVEIRDRDAAALKKLKKYYRKKIEREKFLQFLFYRQWLQLKNYCHKKGIKIIGDIPIYVTYDSVDAWANSGIFKIDNDKNLEFLAGVPPDYFSKTGQLWGNPVYNWDALKQSGYRWWIERIAHNLELFDIARVDHFRGFVDFWQIPHGQTTAMCGSWQKAPAMDFFKTLLKRFPHLPIIAEDLGEITDEVREVIKHFGFANMKILLFAFYEDLEKHPFLPHNYPHNCVAYTGTHDNNTARGWFEHELQEKDRKNLFAYLHKEVSMETIHQELISLLMGSAADMVIIPMQDILGLPETGRMNLPGTARGNWGWRLSSAGLLPELTGSLAELVEKNKRI